MDCLALSAANIVLHLLYYCIVFGTRRQYLSYKSTYAVVGEGFSLENGNN